MIESPGMWLNMFGRNMRPLISPLALKAIQSLTGELDGVMAIDVADLDLRLIEGGDMLTLTGRRGINIPLGISLEQIQAEADRIWGEALAEALQYGEDERWYGDYERRAAAQTAYHVLALLGARV